MKVMTVSSWLNFGHPAPPGRGSAAGRNFLAPPYYSQRAVFASLWALFFMQSVLQSDEFGEFCAHCSLSLHSNFCTWFHVSLFSCTQHRNSVRMTCSIRRLLTYLLTYLFIYLLTCSDASEWMNEWMNEWMLLDTTLCPKKNCGPELWR